ncbi:hypothetical protein [Rhodococcus sp. LB1]|uniref:hypothetical protein n=1 Tax=Rhodococcus sp. LB1 TaxID=1807499 RepID=UPI000779F9D7|nr:hypothetical protein [Rhodococcus sp. LB1]KXX58437.1 hypothetical protein AZG88_45675 [Rhodococcus sp. LB1]
MSPPSRAMSSWATTSGYKNPDEQRFAVESKNGLRMVPLSALPWPHHQYQCPFAIVAGGQCGKYGDAQVAHAAGFLSPDGQVAMKSCPVPRAPVAAHLQDHR